MPDPGLPVTCPYCGTPLHYQESNGETHVYLCPRDGFLVLRPDGRLQKETEEETVRRLFTVSRGSLRRGAALRRLRELRARHEALNRAGLDAYQRNNIRALDEIIEEEHANIEEQRKLMDLLEAPDVSESGEPSAS